LICLDTRFRGSHGLAGNRDFAPFFGTSEFDVLRPGFPTMPREKFEQALRDFDEAEQQSPRPARPRMTMKS
jgi:hypothetical protein